MSPYWDPLIESIVARSLAGYIEDLGIGRTAAVRFALNSELWLASLDHERAEPDRLDLSRRLNREAVLALDHTKPDVLAAVILLQRARLLWEQEEPHRPDGIPL